MQTTGRSCPGSLRTGLAAATLLAASTAAVADPVTIPQGPLYFQFNNLEQVSPNNLITAPSGAREGNWGVFNVSTMQSGAVSIPNKDIGGGPTFFQDDGPGGSRGQVHGVIWGVTNQIAATGTSVVLHGSGGFMDLYWTDAGADTITNADLSGNFGPGNRTGDNQAGKFTQGQFLARLAFDSGVIDGNTTVNILGTFLGGTITGSGFSDSFASVVDMNGDGHIDAQDGLWAAQLDTDWFIVHDGPAAAAAGLSPQRRDLRLSTFTNGLPSWNAPGFNPNYPTGGGNDIAGLRSNDPGRTFIEPRAALGDFVWEDTDGDGVQDAGEPGIGNVSVSLYNCLGVLQSSTSTDASGKYLFSNLLPGDYFVEFLLPAGYAYSPQNQGVDDAKDSDADTTTGRTACTTLDAGETDLSWDAGVYRPATLGDRVWNDTDQDGIQDGGEDGIPGVTVNLYDCAGNLRATDSTDASGNYLFEDLTPGGYRVEFVLPGGFVFSPQDQGSDEALDSDANPAGMTACVTLESGDDNRDVDAGMYRPTTAELGDFVWEDLDADGVQDGGESGIPGVTVRLFDCSGNELASTTTNASGFYLFGNLAAGSYVVKFEPPAGYQFSPKDVGADNADSDADPASGETPCTTLATGESKRTLDAGLYRLATLGDRVWNDTDQDGIQDGGEDGIPGVTVNLRDCAGNLLATDSTDASGNYLFEDLTPGGYMVEFVLPGGMVFSPQDQGANEALDSDANPATGRTACVTLESGDDNRDVDAGMYVPQAPAIDIEKSTNGVDADDPNAGDAPQIAPGGPVSWTYRVTNTGNVPLQNVMVSDDQGVAVSCPKTVLNPGEGMTCTASGVAENLSSTGYTTVPGLCGKFPNSPLYENKGTASGQTVTGQIVQDVDPSHYCNPRHDVGTGTPGYWKNHPEAWPVANITIGGVSYSKVKAIKYMGMSDGDKTVTMFRSLVAAKLNVLIGTDASCISATIAAADAWMASYGPIGSKVKASSKAWKQGEPLYHTLDDYNNGLLCAPSRDSLE